MMCLLARFARSKAITNICACLASVNCGPLTAVAGVVGEYSSGRNSFPGLSFPGLRSIHPLRFYPVNRLSVWQKGEKIASIVFSVVMQWTCSSHLGETWRALKRLELLEAPPLTPLTPLSCSPNFPRAQYPDIRDFFTSLFSGYYVFWLRFVSPTTQTSVGSVSL